MRKEALKMKIIEKLEYSEKEKQISFSLYDKTWCNMESYKSKNSENMEKLKKEIARNIILQHIKIKVNSPNGIELMYAFLKVADEIKGFLGKAVKETDALSDVIWKFTFLLCGGDGKEVKEKAEIFLEDTAVPKFWKYFSEKSKSKATLSIINNNIIKYIRSAETDENGYIGKLRWTRKKAAIDYKRAYVYHKFNSRFNFEIIK